MARIGTTLSSPVDRLGTPARKRRLDRTYWSERGGIAMKNKRRVWVGVVVVLLVAVVAYGLRGQVAPMLGAEDGRRSVTGEGPGATIPVGQRDIVHTITATGNVAPVRQVDMRFSRAGRVQEVHIAPGERVEKGQLLA